MLLLTACTTIPSRTLVFTSGDSTVFTSGSPAVYDDTHDLSCDQVPIDWWCFVGPYWYDKPQGECPAVAVDGLMAGPLNDHLYHWRCDDAVLGTLDGVVDESLVGLGGAQWVFDASGALVSYVEHEVGYPYCGGTASSADAGRRYSCWDTCLVQSVGAYTPGIAPCE